MKRTRLRSKRRDTDKALALVWFIAVARHKPCLMCGTKGPHVEGHHVISQQVLRTEFPRGFQGRTLQELLWDIRNGIPLCSRCHQRHENAVVRVPVRKLPAAAFVFAQEIDLQHRLGARWYAP